MRSALGWDLPPGVTQRMIDESVGAEGPCECCGRAVDDCVCPECRCGAVGDPRCYVEHGMVHDSKQLIGQTRAQIDGLRSQIADLEQYVTWLEESDKREADEPHEPNESGFTIHPVRRMVASKKRRR